MASSSTASVAPTVSSVKIVTPPQVEKYDFLTDGSVYHSIQWYLADYLTKHGVKNVSNNTLKKVIEFMFSADSWFVESGSDLKRYLVVADDDVVKFNNLVDAQRFQAADEHYVLYTVHQDCEKWKTEDDAFAAMLFSVVRNIPLVLHYYEIIENHGDWWQSFSETMQLVWLGERFLSKSEIEGFMGHLVWLIKNQSWALHEITGDSLTNVCLKNSIGDASVLKEFLESPYTLSQDTHRFLLTYEKCWTQLYEGKGGEDLRKNACMDVLSFNNNVALARMLLDTN